MKTFAPDAPVRRARWAGWAWLAASLLVVPTALAAATAPADVAEAARTGDVDRVRELLRRGGDVNASPLDGSSALHWAAERGDAPLAELLLIAGADVRSTTRLGAYTPLHIASELGHAELIQSLLGAGAEVNAQTSTGATPLMLAARSGDVGAIDALIGGGADLDHQDAAREQTALMYAAAAGRTDAVRRLVEGGASSEIQSRTIDEEAREEAFYGSMMRRRALDQAREATLEKIAEQERERAEKEAAEEAKKALEAETTAVALEAPEAELQALEEPREASADAANPKDAHGFSLAGASKDVGAEANPASAEPAAADRELKGEPDRAKVAPSTDEAQLADAGAAKEPKRRFWRRKKKEEAPAPERPRPMSYGKLIGKHGGLTALHYAARQGHEDTVRALLEAGATLDARATDGTTPLLIATINGRFDTSMALLEAGADPTLASDAGATPLYGALNVHWAPHSFYPQPSPAQEETTYLELMQRLIDEGADVNARLEKKLWYTGYNFDQEGADQAGATPFWRAAQAADVEAMKLLVAAGADHTVATKIVPERRLPNGRNWGDDLNANAPKLGDPAVTPMQVASGAGYVGNFHRLSPGGFLPAVRYLVEELGCSAATPDYKGYTPLHNAAARGDLEMIVYLLFHGADPKAVARTGETVADLANGPVQRIQPFPEALEFLEKMGSKNNDNCVSC